MLKNISKVQLRYKILTNIHKLFDRNKLPVPISMVSDKVGR